MHCGMGIDPCSLITWLRNNCAVSVASRHATVPLYGIKCVRFEPSSPLVLLGLHHICLLWLLVVEQWNLKPNCFSPSCPGPWPVCRVGIYNSPSLVPVTLLGHLFNYLAVFGARSYVIFYGVFYHSCSQKKFLKSLCLLVFCRSRRPEVSS